VQVGDIVEFTNTGYLGVVLGFTNFDAVRIFITDEEVLRQRHINNPTVMGIKTAMHHTKVISSIEVNT
jgi:hypothetical protein